MGSKRLRVFNCFCCRLGRDVRSYYSRGPALAHPWSAWYGCRAPGTLSCQTVTNCNCRSETAALQQLPIVRNCSNCNCRLIELQQQLQENCRIAFFRSVLHFRSGFAGRPPIPAQRVQSIDTRDTQAFNSSISPQKDPRFLWGVQLTRAP